MRFDSVGLRYGAGPEVFTDIDFTLPAGSFHFLTGASGAGKSSLLSLIYLARRPTRGSIHLFGKEVTALPRRQLPAIRRRVGVVFQDFRLIDHLTALENVALPLKVAGYAEDHITRDVAELLSWVDLKDHMDARPPTLSGGQKQRVAIARAVISRPELLLADEPTGNVDDRIATRLLRLFIELNKLGTTVLIATHSESLIERFPFPRLHLEGGRLLLLDGQKGQVGADGGTAGVGSGAGAAGRGVAADLGPGSIPESSPGVAPGPGGRAGVGRLRSDRFSASLRPTAEPRPGGSALGPTAEPRPGGSALGPAAEPGSGSVFTPRSRRWETDR